MKKKVVVATLLTTILGGCGGYSEVSQLNSIQAVESESEVSTSYSLSYSDEQNLIYAQVSDRSLLDLTTLEACSKGEVDQVVRFLDSVNAQLTGAIPSKDGVIDTKLTDYLLTEFERTPYTWARETTTIMGIDSESGCIVADVTYGTTNKRKPKLGNSYIVKGEPNYDKKMEVRFDRYADIMIQKYEGRGEDWGSALSDFTKIYGSPESIYESQRNHSLTEDIYHEKVQYTYNGLTEGSAANTGGTMTVRYVLNNAYTLGINTGMNCTHLYVTDYAVDNDITGDMTAFTKEGYDTVSDSMQDLMYRYFTCIDESNYDGLYKLTHNFGRYDKYYSDVFANTYNKHENFSMTIFDISGTKVKAGVEVSSKVRGKNSNMSFPVYTDRYFVEASLDNDVLAVDDMTLLSRKLEGEPAIETGDNEKEGFSLENTLSESDKAAISNLIAELGVIQIEGKYQNDEFYDVVDMSIGESDVLGMCQELDSIKADAKVSYIDTYLYGDSSYASVKVKELYQKGEGKVIESNATYDFITKGGKWYVYSFDITSNVTLDTDNLTTYGATAYIKDGKVVEVDGGKSSTTVESENSSSVSVSFTHSDKEIEQEEEEDETQSEEVDEEEDEDTTSQDEDTASFFD